jgi:hypothetical protein
MTIYGSVGFYDLPREIRQEIYKMIVFSSAADFLSLRRISKEFFDNVLTYSNYELVEHKVLCTIASKG